MTRLNWAILLTSTCLIAGMHIPAFCDYTEDIPSTLKRYEVALFGQVQSGSILDRVRALEKNLWKKSQDGTLPERLDRIGQMLNRGSSQPAGEGSRAKHFSASRDQPPAPPPSAAPNNAGGFPPPASAAGSKPPAPVDKHRVAQTLLEQAMQAYKAGNAAEAQRLFLAVLNMEPNNDDANYNLGVIAESRKDYATARNYYQKALRSSPGDASLIDAVKQMDRYLSTPAYAPR